MFKAGQFVRNKDNDAVYLLMNGSQNNSSKNVFAYILVFDKNGCETTSTVISSGLFPTNSYEVVELHGDSFKPVEKFYKVGDKFKYKTGNDRNVHIIATVNTNDTINLIDTETGTRWYTDGLKVDNWNKISEKEIKDIVNLFNKVN